MILFGNRVFAYIIKVEIEMRSCWIRLGPKSTEVFLEAEMNIQKPLGGLYVKM